MKTTAKPPFAPMPRISHADICDLGLLWMPLNEIAEKTGVARATVQFILEKNGIRITQTNKPTRPGSKPTFDYAAARKAFEAGEALTCIAARLGVAESTVRRGILEAARAAS